MEFRKAQTTTTQANDFEFAQYLDDDRHVEARLNALLAITRENERQKELFHSEQERFEASLINHPLTTQKAFAQFGLLLGIFPPMALFTRFLLESQPRGNEFWIPLLLIFVNLVCAVTGYFSGKLIGKMVAETEKWSWSGMLLTLPFIGILWGLMTGGAGGFIFLGIGALFGAIIASMVGVVAFPVFTVFHRWLKKGDVIDRNQFLPIALGITLIISALFFGLNIR